MNPEADRVRDLDAGLDKAVRERLEQLRILESGYPIRVAETELGASAPCIDTPEGLLRAREYLPKLQSGNARSATATSLESLR